MEITMEMIRTGIIIQTQMDIMDRVVMMEMNAKIKITKAMYIKIIHSIQIIVFQLIYF